MCSGAGACALPQAGFPIRNPAGQRVLAPHRGLSQLAASFIGFPCQGIHRVPLVSSRLSVLINDVMSEISFKSKTRYVLLTKMSDAYLSLIKR